MNRKRIRTALLIATVAIGLAIGSPAQATLGKAVKKRNDLTGTWLVNIHFNLAATDAAAGGKFLRMAATSAPTSEPAADAATQAPFNTLITFHSEGTLAENSQLDYFPPPGTPGRGAWEKIGEGEFSATLYGVLITGFDTAEFAGTYRERVRLRTDDAGDQFTGMAVVEIYDAAGNFVFSFDGTYQGKRAAVAPAP